MERGRAVGALHGTHAIGPIRVVDPEAEGVGADLAVLHVVLVQHDVAAVDLGERGQGQAVVARGADGLRHG